MKILIIPEIVEQEETMKKMYEVENKATSQTKTMAIANMGSWSLLNPNEKNTTLEMLMAGYSSFLTDAENTHNYNIYIGLISKEEFPRVDTIIYMSEAAKDIVEIRGLEEFLPLANENVVLNDGTTLENEIYKRTIIYNLSQGL